MKGFWRALPHLTIVLSMATVTFFVIDRINRSMAFMTSEMSKFMFLALAICALLTSCSLLGYHWKADARSVRKEQKELQKQKEQAEILFRQHEAVREPEKEAEPSDGPNPD